MSRPTDTREPSQPVSRDAIAAALQCDHTFGYGRVARVLSALNGSQSKTSSTTPGAEELRALLLDAADSDFSLGLAPVKLPPSIAAEYCAGIARVREACLEAPDAFFSIDNDLFVKDLAVCLGQLLPAGARLVDLHSGLPRRLLLLQGASLPSVLGFFWLAGGFNPWFETHVDPRNLSEFSEPGLVRMYLRVATVLEVNPQVLGVFGGSWFYDPCLEELSPHLAYLQNLPRQHGAELLRGTTTPGTIGSALVKSRRRREAYEQGRYRPQNYFLVWPRRALLDWARVQRESPTLRV